MACSVSYSSDVFEEACPPEVDQVFTAQAADMMLTTAYAYVHFWIALINPFHAHSRHTAAVDDKPHERLEQKLGIQAAAVIDNPTYHFHHAGMA